MTLVIRRVPWFLLLIPALVSCARPPVPPPLSRDRPLESLEQATRWPNPDPRVVMTLANEFLTTHRERSGYVYFEERVQGEPHRPLFLALDGLLQARLAPEVALLHRVDWVNAAASKLDRATAAGGGLERYLRGLVFAELPSRFGRAGAATVDLEWMLAHAEQFPPGLRRGAWRGLAHAYAALGRTNDAAHARAMAGSDEQPFLSDFSVNGRDGFRFGPPSLLALPGGVYVATGYDFADIAFVTVEHGIVAIDAGTTEENAARALAALRTKTTAPLVAVIVTHSHWDHVGGLGAFTGPGVEVIAQASFSDELHIVNAEPAPFRYFFGERVKKDFTFAPTHVVAAPETRVIGGRRFGLYPAHGGETSDALLVHLPDAGVVFVGDAFMPYFGAPFVAEGSVDGLFDTIAQIRALAPTLLVHGHPPLTLNFTADALEPLATALAVVRDHAVAGAHDGKVLADVLDENLLPATLADHPNAVLPFLLLRDHLIQRLYQQRTGYWKSDGEGIDVLSRSEWSRAVDLLAHGEATAFAETARGLTDRGDFVMALRIAELGLAAHPDTASIATERRRALEGLRLKNQMSDPFKVIVYSDMAGESILPVPAAR